MSESFVGLNNVIFTITYKSQRADNILNIEWRYNWVEAIDVACPDYLKNRIKMTKYLCNKGYLDKTYEINVAELKHTDNEIVSELVNLHKSGIIMSQQDKLRKDKLEKMKEDKERDQHRCEGASVMIVVIILIAIIMGLSGLRLTVKP